MISMIILAFILGPLLETALRKSLIMQQTVCSPKSGQNKGASGKAELPTAASALLR
jgi:hypothetical protein